MHRLLLHTLFYHIEWDLQPYQVPIIDNKISEPRKKGGYSESSTGGTVTTGDALSYTSVRYLAENKMNGTRTII